MSASSIQASREPQQAWLQWLNAHADWPMLLAALSILSLGLVMLTSASISIAERDFGNPLYFMQRQLIYVMLGLLAALVAYQLPLKFWHHTSALWLLLALLLLAVVLVPGIGREVNGSIRWIAVGPISVQVSELAKLFIAFYLASYLVRHEAGLRAMWSGLLKPLLVVSLAALLLLMEPDFGATLVLVSMTLAMVFIAGARVGQFALLLALAIGAGISLIVSSPYRLNRLTAFMDPWADPFDSGFQLTQALIAIGSGSWGGVGLGGSVQKLFYLPEAHNDFLFAVLAEELGLLGVLLVIALFGVLLWRMFRLARWALDEQRLYSAYLVYGFATWLGLQVFINLGVNMGLLPTKGLTLPLMSAGGSSMMVTLVVLGLVQRVHTELSNPKVAESSSRLPVLQKRAAQRGEA